MTHEQFLAQLNERLATLSDNEYDEGRRSAIMIASHGDPGFARRHWYMTRDFLRDYIPSHQDMISASCGAEYTCGLMHEAAELVALYFS